MVSFMLVTRILSSDAPTSFRGETSMLEQWQRCQGLSSPFMGPLRWFRWSESVAKRSIRLFSTVFLILNRFGHVHSSSGVRSAASCGCP